MRELDLTKKDKSQLKSGLNILDWEAIQKHPQFSVVVDELQFLITDLFKINSAIVKITKEAKDNPFGVSDSDNHKLMYLNFSQFAYNDELNTIIKTLIDSTNENGDLVIEPINREEIEKDYGIRKEVREFAKGLISQISEINKVK